jgi:sugar lactone lactonase YvrE
MTGCVLSYSPNGEHLATIGATPDHYIDEEVEPRVLAPRGIAENAQGHLYVADAQNDCVWEFNAESERVGKFATIQRPCGLAVDSQDRVVVCSTRRDAVQVTRYSANGDTNLCLEASQCELGVPYGVAVDSKDRIIVSDQLKNIVLVFNKDGTLAQRVGSGLLKGPTGLAVDSKDYIIVCDSAHHVHIFGHDGTHLETFGSFGESENALMFRFPRSVAVIPGWLFVSDGSGSIRKISF